MPYYSESELRALGLKHCGTNVKISKDARIYDFSELSIGDNSRIDDFSVLSGDITIGRYVQIAPHTLVNGHGGGVVIDDFCALAMYACVIATSDNYYGGGLVNPTTPKQYHADIEGAVKLEKHVIVGAYSFVMPGVTLKEGTAVGCQSFINQDTQAWHIYVGAPAKILRERQSDIILKQAQEVI